MEEYLNYVKSLADNTVDKIFMNNDGENMVIVVSEMLAHAHDEFRIFAGCLLDDYSNSDTYVQAVSDYIEKGGALRVLLNKYDESKIQYSPLFTRLAYYKSYGKDIVVKSTQDKPYIIIKSVKKFVHFAIGDRVSYRLETDPDKRTAICNMNAPIVASKYADFFDGIFEDDRSVEIELVSLFNMKS